MISDRSLKHWIFFLERIENGADRRRTVEVKLHFVGNTRERAKMMRKNDANHCFKNPKTQVPNKSQVPVAKSLPNASPALAIWALEFRCVSAAFAPRRTTRPADRARSASTCRRRPASNKPGRRLCRNKFRTNRVNQLPSRRGAR